MYRNGFGSHFPLLNRFPLQVGDEIRRFWAQVAFPIQAASLNGIGENHPITRGNWHFHSNRNHIIHLLNQRIALASIAHDQGYSINARLGKLMDRVLGIAGLAIAEVPLPLGCVLGAVREIDQCILYAMRELGQGRETEQVPVAEVIYYHFVGFGLQVGAQVGIKPCGIGQADGRFLPNGCIKGACGQVASGHIGVALVGLVQDEVSIVQYGFPSHPDRRHRRFQFIGNAHIGGIERISHVVEVRKNRTAIRTRTLLSSKLAAPRHIKQGFAAGEVRLDAVVQLPCTRVHGIVAEIGDGRNLALLLQHYEIPILVVNLSVGRWQRNMCIGRIAKGAAAWGIGIKNEGVAAGKGQVVHQLGEVIDARIGISKEKDALGLCVQGMEAGEDGKQD